MRTRVAATIALAGLTAAACSGGGSSDTARSTTTARPSDETTTSTEAAAAPSTSTSTSTTAAPVGTAPPTTTRRAVTTTTARRPATVTTARRAVTATTAGAAAAAGPGPKLGPCTVFPADNSWNQDVRSLPIHPQSDTFMASISAQGKRFLHADFGSDPTYGIPYVITATAPAVPVTYDAYGDESDPGPFPIPLDAPVESGSDGHVLAVDTRTCTLYELFEGRRSGNGWMASSGAKFDLGSNKLRPDSWTSADAAGLPILPGLVRYDEVIAGEIRHALRFTVDRTQRGYIHPATHQAGRDDPNLPPMGLRVRLKASFDLSPFQGQARVVLAALQRYGMIVADNGSSWFITGAKDSRWDDDDLNQLKTVPGSAFEAVQTGSIQR